MSTTSRTRSVTPRFACSKWRKKRRSLVLRLGRTATCSCDRKLWVSRRSSSSPMRTWGRENLNCRKTRCMRPRSGSHLDTDSSPNCRSVFLNARVGIFGLLYALGSMATLLMMCDRRDLGTAVGERPSSAISEINWEDFAGPADTSEAKEFFEPNLYIYDAYPGGIGFSEPQYRPCDTLLT